MPKPIPEGYHSITPYLIVEDADKAIAFYKKAFGAKDSVCMRTPEGKVMHAELEVFGSTVMLAQEWPEYGCFSPTHYKGTPVGLHLYVDDCDAVFQKTLKAGATVLQPLAEMFWGDRFGKVKDPFGHEWAIATHVKDLSEKQIAAAGKEWMAQQQAKGKARIPAAA